MVLLWGKLGTLTLAMSTVVFEFDVRQLHIFHRIELGKKG